MRTPAKLLATSAFAAVIVVGSLMPSYAHAQIGAALTIEAPGPLLTSIIAQTTGVSPKNALDALAWRVSKMAIQSITRSTVNWINSGFNGSPAFVSDLNQNLSVLSDTVANNFFQELNQTAIQNTGFNLTSPFQDQITQQLRANYYRATGSLLGLNQYDLSGHSADPRAFLNGDFNQGGFNAFFSANKNPANNPIGAYMLASNALSNQIDAASRQRNAEYLAGKSYLPWRGNCPAASDKTSLAKTEPCLGNAVRTPGAVIEAQLENNLGTGIRQLELADSINEVVGALIGQLVNQVLGSGGLLGASQPAPGGGSSYVDRAANPAQYSTSSSNPANGVTQIIAGDISTLTTLRDNWQKILDAANAAQQACGVRDDITQVINQATDHVAAASASINRETAVSSDIQTASAGTAVDASSQLTIALTNYQSYLSASTTPSSNDVTYAATQSSSASGTLYTQMVDAKNTCLRT